MSGRKDFFERFANKMTVFAGSSIAFTCAVIVVLLWAITGPIFGYSSDWQLVINTGTTIITFLMVFLIQKTQNKESKAIQLKLDELIAAHDKASNRMVNIENLTESELDKIQEFYRVLSTQQEEDCHQSHSIDPSANVHLKKDDDFSSSNTNKEKI